MAATYLSPSRTAWLACTAVLVASVQARAGDASGKLAWEFGGVVQADHRAFVGDEDEFLWRRIRPSLEARWGEVVTLKVVPELSGGEVRLTDAYLDMAMHARAALRVGRFKTPVGMERLQSGSASAFNERGFTSELAPARDVGVQVHGTFADARATYAVGVFNGTVDGRDGHSVNADDAHDVAARIVVQPWKGSGHALSGLVFALAASRGDRHGTGNEFLPRYRTPGQETFFRYRSSVRADGRQARWSPQVAWYGGALGVMGEYVSSRQALRDVSTSMRATLDHRAWQVVGRWVLSGEEANPRGGVKPAQPFAPNAGRWGALEAVARIGGLEIDEDAFMRFADAREVASSASSWGVGLNWYPTDNLKLAANYTETRFGHADAGAVDSREDERVFFTRVQLTF